MRRDEIKLELLDKAIRIATQYHDTFRFVSGLPYIIHPHEVLADGFKRGIRDEEHLCTFILHDTIEDTKYTQDQMNKDFGRRVTNIVLEVSKVGIDDAGIQEKMAFMKTFKGKTLEALLLKISDRFCNIRDYERVGKRPWYPAYYALQAYPLIDAFNNNYQNIEEQISKDVAISYRGIVIYIRNLVKKQYSLDIENVEPENIEKMDTILRTRNKGNATAQEEYDNG